MAPITFRDHGIRHIRNYSCPHIVAASTAAGHGRPQSGSPGGWYPMITKGFASVSGAKPFVIIGS